MEKKVKIKRIRYLTQDFNPVNVILPSGLKCIWCIFPMTGSGDGP